MVATLDGYCNVKWLHAGCSLFLLKKRVRIIFCLVLSGFGASKRNTRLPLHALLPSLRMSMPVSFQHFLLFAESPLYSQDKEKNKTFQIAHK